MNSLKLDASRILLTRWVTPLRRDKLSVFLGARFFFDRIIELVFENLNKIWRIFDIKEENKTRIFMAEYEAPEQKRDFRGKFWTDDGVYWIQKLSDFHQSYSSGR